jgi:hypothetical protein
MSYTAMIDAERIDTILDRWPPQIEFYGGTLETLADHIFDLGALGPSAAAIRDAATLYCTCEVIRRWTESHGHKAALAEACASASCWSAACTGSWRWWPSINCAPLSPTRWASRSDDRQPICFAWRPGDFCRPCPIHPLGVVSVWALDLC